MKNSLEFCLDDIEQALENGNGKKYNELCKILFVLIQQTLSYNQREMNIPTTVVLSVMFPQKNK